MYLRGYFCGMAEEGIGIRREGGGKGSIVPSPLQSYLTIFLLPVIIVAVFS